MILLKYTGEKTGYTVIFKKISKHILQVTGDFPVKKKGFELYRMEDPEDLWDYTEYKTVYREVDGGVQFSDDESIYTAPPDPEPVPEPEPYVPTLEEVRTAKLYETAMACEQVIYAGVDVELPAGTEHFSLTEKDQINLFGKQAQMAAGAEKFEYHQDGHPCRYYSAAEMQQIIKAALGFVTYQTTYCNALNMWVMALEEKEEVSAIVYGCDIPEEYQSEVLKDLNAKMGEGR